MLMHACFRALKAFKASSNNNTHSDFLLAPSPARCLFSSCDMHDAPYELLVVAHKAKKSIHFCVGLGWCTFCSDFQIQIAGLHTFLGDSVCQVVDLFFKKTTL